MSNTDQEPNVSGGDILEPPATTKITNGLDESKTSIQEVESTLGMLKLDSVSSADKGETKQLNLNLEEIDLSNTRDCPPIVLIAGDKHEIRPFANKYTIQGKFLVPAKINKWAMVILFDECIVRDVERGLRLFSQVQDFADRYAMIGRSRGISVSHLDTIQYVPSQPSYNKTIVTMTKDELKSELRKLLAQLNDNLIDHALIILPENCPSWVHAYLQYLETKEWGSVKRPGINLLTRTSRMQYETLKRLGIRSQDHGQTSLIPQLWLKYNTKLGGINVALKHTFDTHDLKFLSDNFLILSIDLCKLGAATSEPIFEGLDIAAAVGMWDLASNKMSYRTQTRAQRSDIAVVDIDLLVRDIILSYKQRKAGQLPASIIIFRSVTYQNNVEEVAQQELTSIKKMLAVECKKLEKEMPLLTYLRVPKKKKISKAEQRLKGSPSELIQTGSLVNSIMSDKIAASPARDNPAAAPSHSSDDSSEPLADHRKALKVYDENNLSSTSICAMVHSLSYLSPRTTSKTRPTPIDLADLANERTRHISAGWLEDNRDQYKENKELVLEDLNHFLVEVMGDEEYRDRLYYA